MSASLLPRAWVIAACALMTGLAHAHGWPLDVPWSDDPLKAGEDTTRIQAAMPAEVPMQACPFAKDWSTPLTLEEAMGLTWCQNPKLQAALADVRAQTAMLGQAKAAYWPTTAASVGRLRNQLQSPGTGTSDQTSTGTTSYANVSWRLFDFGTREANRQSAEWNVVSAAQTQRATVRAVMGNVIQQYFDAATAQSAMAAREEAEAVAKATFELASRRERQGIASRSDTLQSSAALGQARLARSRARGALDKATAMLAYVIGVPSETPISLPALKPLRPGRHPMIDATVAEVIDAHPTVSAAKAQWESARQRVDATRAEGQPTLDGGASYFLNGYPGQGLTDRQRVRTLSLTVSIPLFDGFAQRYKVQAEQAQVDKLAWELENTQRQIGLEALKARADESTAYDNLGLAESLVDTAHESLASSRRRYESGAADILEILNTQTALANAQQEKIQSLAEWRAAQLHLWTLFGHLDQVFQGDLSSQEAQP